jgi:hypothetical protein
MSYLTHSHFGGFLLHRGWFRLTLARKARAVLSTSCNAVSPRQYIHRADHIGVFLVPTVHTQKPGLRFPILSCHVPAGRAGLAGVVRRNWNEYPASPVEFVLKLTAKLEPALVEDGFIQPRLLGYVFSRCFGSASARLAHIAHLQILNNDHSVVFADRRCSLVQEVFTGVTDTGVDFLNSPFGFVPVFAELDFATHTPLVFFQALLVFFETTKRLNEAAVAQSGESDNAHVDSNGTGGRWHGLLYFALGLDACGPLVTRLTDGDVFGRPKNYPAVAVAHLAQFGERDAAVGLVDYELFGIREAKTISSAFTLEAREVGAFFKEVFVGTLCIFQRLLQGMRGRFFEPRKLFLPLGKEVRHCHVADEFSACVVVGLLQRQSLVIDKPTRTRKAAHVALLLAIWHEFVLEGLQAFHGLYYSLVYEKQ